jgi:hypothetical protein
MEVGHSNNVYLGQESLELFKTERRGVESHIRLELGNREWA